MSNVPGVELVDKGNVEESVGTRVDNVHGEEEGDDEGEEDDEELSHVVDENLRYGDEEDLQGKGEDMGGGEV